jgi:PPM family protein phosphatase
VAHTVSWAARSESGTKKPDNEDAWIVFAAGSEKSLRFKDPGNYSLDSGDLVLAISDGMGGGSAGDLASRLILVLLSQIIPKTIRLAAQGLRPDYLEHLEQAIQAVHSSINRKGFEDSNLFGMAATITLAWITPENIYIAQVGDTRLYLHRDETTTQITEDDNFVWKRFNRGEISEREYRIHPGRCILHEVIGGGHVKLKPCIKVVSYQKGDRFMLCSDGLIDGLSQGKIHSHLNHKDLSVCQVLDSLVESAVEIAGRDDTTCIVFDIL